MGTCPCKNSPKEETGNFNLDSAKTNIGTTNSTFPNLKSSSFFEADYEVKAEELYGFFTKDGRLRILGDKFDFLNENNCTMTINGKQVPFTKRLEGQGSYHVIVRLNSEIKLEDTSFMFALCTSLVNVDLSNFDLSNVNTMFQMFYETPELNSINFKGVDTSKVKSFERMFSNCSALKNIDLSSFKTDSAVNMSKMFNYCSALEFLDLSNFNTSKVENMESMFFKCIKMTNLMENFDMRNVKNKHKMFGDCATLDHKIKEKFGMEDE